MSENGGKSSDKGGKSATRSSAGKSDSSEKSKKGRQVQFDSEGGKGNKSNGTKKSTSKAKEPTVLERRLEQELPRGAVCLMDYEAAEILQDIQDKMVILSQDPDIKLPVSFDMGLMYAKRDGNQVKPGTVKRILQPLKKHGVSDSEICLIANISPESEEEVFALIPALKRNKQKMKDPLRIALSELAHLKESLANLKDL